jgi:acetyl-CoA carboxylase biotin carboxyl carrier protein
MADEPTGDATVVDGLTEAAPAGERLPDADGRTAAADPPAVAPDDAALFGVIDRLAAILDHSDLVELEVQVGQTGLTLRKPAALAQAVAVAGGVPGGPAADQPGTPAGGPAAGRTAAAADHVPPPRPSVKAPLTGIWYGSPAPGSAPYIQVGGEVAVGQVIGLIEAMKLFNEIKSDLAGRVVKVNAENGKLVKAKQPLVEVEPL